MRSPGVFQRAGAIAEIDDDEAADFRVARVNAIEEFESVGVGQFSFGDDGVEAALLENAPRVIGAAGEDALPFLIHVQDAFLQAGISDDARADVEDEFIPVVHVAKRTLRRPPKPVLPRRVKAERASLRTAS